MQSSIDNWNVQEQANTQKNKFKNNFITGPKNASLLIFPNSFCQEIEMLSGSLSKLVGLNSRNSDILTKAAL